MAPSRESLATVFQKPAPLRSRQPFAAVWTLFSLARYLASLPFLYAYFLIPSNRGTPKRTLSQEITFAQARAIFKRVADIRFQEPRPLVPGKAWKDRFVLLEPAEESRYRGVAVDPFVKPAQNPGIWYPRRPGPADLHDKQRVVLQFHGGAYHGGTYEPHLSEPPGRMFADKLSAFVLRMGQRKSSVPGCHFPAQLQDAISSYSSLLQEGVKPQNIIVFGNSSGGHMALNLLRYILEHPLCGLPTPAAIAASSPWGDLVRSNYDDLTKRPSLKKDYLEFTYVQFGRDSFLPPGVIDVAEHPYLSPLHQPFACGDVPVWLVAGEDEVVFQENYTTAQNLAAIPGNKVEFHVAPDSPHDVLWTGAVFGFLEEARSACDNLAIFLKKHGV